MLKNLFILLLIANSLPLFSQTNWAVIENNLSQQLDQQQITSKEWYSKLKKEAGYFGALTLWTKSEKILPKKDTSKKLKLYFAEKFQVVMPNGNKYATAYLENNTADSITISRIDATIANVQEYFFIDNKWFPFRRNQTSTCGNSYFDVKLAPKHQLHLELNNDTLVDGKVKVRYKISIVLGNQIVESNEIEVFLHPSQLKRMKESLSKA